MAKIQRNFRLEPDVDAALSAASDPDSNPKTAIVDRALRVELGLTPASTVESIHTGPQPATCEYCREGRCTHPDHGERRAGDGTPEVEPSPPESRTYEELLDGFAHAIGVHPNVLEQVVRSVKADNGQPPTREPSEADVRGWFTSLDGIDQQKIMVGLGLVAPPAPEQIATHTTASFEAILNQVESAPEETRRAVLERLLGEQLTGGADRSHADLADGPGQPPAGSSPAASIPPPEPELTTTERAIAQEISVEQGLDMPTAERMARRIVQKRAEAL